MILVKVKHVKPGFFAFYNGRRRYPNDVFPVPESDFSPVWMEKKEVKVEPKVETEKVKHKRKTKRKSEAGAL